MNLAKESTAPRLISLGYAALGVAVIFAIACTAFYFYVTLPYIRLPADLLMWAETDFVGQIIKFTTGTPLYTSPEHSNSSIYTPGAPLLSYLIVKLSGQPITVPALRVVQLIFVILAAILATRNARIMQRMAYPDTAFPYPKTWTVLAFLVLFLAATSPRVNQFAHNLHMDALALLVSMFAWWTVLNYIRSPNWSRLLLMVLAPVLGYTVKQFLISWIGVIGIVILLQQPSNIRLQVLRIGAFVGAAIAGVLAIIGVFYAIWGDDFLFWTFEITGGARKRITLMDPYSLSLPRMADHLLRAWMEIGIGVFGGWLLMRGANLAKFGSLFLGWLALISSEVLSSGAGWNVLYHFGPGVMIGVTWLLAALPKAWLAPSVEATSAAQPRLYTEVTHPILGLLGIITVLIALHVVPSRDENEARWFPGKTPAGEVYQYIRAIEREFDGFDAEKVLLDVGNWVYMRYGVVARDRAVALADQPPGGIYENFDVLVRKIRDQYYDKILVHDFHQPTFLYDWFDWERTSGVRAALEEHYVEVRTIPAVEDGGLRKQIMFSGPVSVLVPRVAERP